MFKVEMENRKTTKDNSKRGIRVVVSIQMIKFELSRCIEKVT